MWYPSASESAKGCLLAATWPLIFLAPLCVCLEAFLRQLRLGSMLTLHAHKCTRNTVLTLLPLTSAHSFVPPALKHREPLERRKRGWSGGQWYRYWRVEKQRTRKGGRKKVHWTFFFYSKKLLIIVWSAISWFWDVIIKWNNFFRSRGKMLKMKIL